MAGKGISNSVLDNAEGETQDLDLLHGLLDQCLDLGHKREGKTYSLSFRFG